MYVGGLGGRARRILGSAMPVFDDGTETLDLDTVDESALWTLTCLPVIVVDDWLGTWRSLCPLCGAVVLRHAFASRNGNGGRKGGGRKGGY